jgi:hypothetical protein
MQFSSFAEALHICLTSAPDSPEQEAALTHCLLTAPPDLRLILTQRLGLTADHASHSSDHQPSCDCGCCEQ